MSGFIVAEDDLLMGETVVRPACRVPHVKAASVCLCYCCRNKTLLPKPADTGVTGSSAQ